MKKPRSPGPKSVNSVDLHFGDKIRDRRLALNMSQVALGKDLGVSFQQIQKYEKGSNRISAARLYEVCQVLGVPIASMFENIPHSAPRLATKAAAKKNGRDSRSK
jgi:transcriptional regulator with XRE-family HTH domain